MSRVSPSYKGTLYNSHTRYICFKYRMAIWCPVWGRWNSVSMDNCKSCPFITTPARGHIGACTSRHQHDHSHTLFKNNVPKIAGLSVSGIEMRLWGKHAARLFAPLRYRSLKLPYCVGLLNEDVLVVGQSELWPSSIKSEQTNSIWLFLEVLKCPHDV